MEVLETPTVAVIGLGYVGLPLVMAFGKHFESIGFDLSQERVSKLRDGIDTNGDFAAEAFKEKRTITFTSDASALQEADFIIVAVPTPIDKAKQPNLEPLRLASETIAKNIKRGCTVVFESTVYPGVTEEFCQPIIEAGSGLRCPEDFSLGYSPERINPGDRNNRLETIVKVVAGKDEATLNKVSQLYAKIIQAGVHEAESIKVAEAAKVIENTQRDLNISLMNELAIIFNEMNIDTSAVLKAAATKWNFLPFTPGLVGGHCIGVDPYYLTHKAEMLGYHPQVILAGRKINDGMGKFIAEQTIKQMSLNNHRIANANVLVMGITFKENCNDIRNSRVIDIIRELKSYGSNVFVCDPRASNTEVESEYGISLSNWQDLENINAVVFAVAHEEFKAIDLAKLKRHCEEKACFIDVKAAFPPSEVEKAGYQLWRL